MKLSEDKEIVIQEPVGRFETDECQNTELFKLVKVIPWPPSKLELVFLCDSNIENNKIGWISIKNNSPFDENYLLNYMKGLANLIGHTWSEILEWNFRFDEASRLS
jgi:hypothetical protein